MNNMLLDNLADWIETHGIIVSEKNRSNEYVGVRILEVYWREHNYRIVQVDGMTCRIEKTRN